MFTPRPYQSDAITAGVDFLHGNSRSAAFEILPTGSGKSVVIANIAKELHEPTIILQPIKEILEQNVKKFRSQGLRADVYSASGGEKHVGDVTFATIGSVINKVHLFKKHSKIIIDECHLVNPSYGMYFDFINSIPDARVLGLTATPYRLTSDFEGAKLEFLNRSQPRLFTDLIYYVQNDVLFNAGHLAALQYYDFNAVDRSRLQLNGKGTDFTEDSIRSYYRQINMPKMITERTHKILQHRRNVLVFCATIAEARQVCANIPGAEILTGETEIREREKILSRFTSGICTCLVNVGVLTTGFDYPELEAVLLGRSTMSLALYYQIIGRVMRPWTYMDGSRKTGWVVDMGGNLNLFGKIESMQIKQDNKGCHSIWNNGRSLTDVTFSRN